MTLPAPSAPFQGPLAFGSQNTAFPPFTISFLADQLAAKGSPVEEVQRTVRDLARQAAADWGEQLRQTMSDIAQTTRDKYDESLARYQSLLDEKIGDYEQLSEERGRALDLRGLAQHLERTFPFRLAAPSSQASDLDEVRDGWQEQVDAQFHRATCLGLMDRIQARLPVEIRLDRVKPAYIAADRVGDELRRVVEMAGKQADARGRQPPPTGAAGGAGQPDVCPGCGDYCHDQGGQPLRGRGLWAAGPAGGARSGQRPGRSNGPLPGGCRQRAPSSGGLRGRLVRDLERLRETVAESKKGGRVDLVSLLRQLNDMVHLELEDLEALLSQAVGHEYDKWAQRQLVRE